MTVMIDGVSFGPEYIDVVYMEERDVDNAVGVKTLRTTRIPVALVELEAAEVVQACQDLLDKALVAVRNPPPFTH